MNLQSYGRAPQGSEMVIRGAGRRFSMFSLMACRICSVMALDRASHVMQARKLMAMSHQVTAAQLADESFDLKSLLPRKAPTRIREVAT